MWWVKEHPDHSRGGFQDRDVGRSLFDKDYGPDFGIDFARFADPPNIQKDADLLEKIEEALQAFLLPTEEIDIIVRNGFVILKGRIESEFRKSDIEKMLNKIPNIKHLIQVYS